MKFSAGLELIHLADLQQMAFSISLKISVCITNQLPLWIKRWEVQEQRVMGPSCSEKTQESRKKKLLRVVNCGCCYRDLFG